MQSDAVKRWLDHLAARGDRAASPVHGYDRLAVDWQLTFEHGLPEHLIYLLVSGSIEGAVGISPVGMQAGSLLWVPPRTPFHLHATGDIEPMLYRFRLATREPCPVPHLLVPDAWAVRTTVDAIVLELGGALEFRAERLRALLVVLFSSIFRAAGAGQRIAPLPAAIRARIESYVDADPAARPTIADLAAEAGLSVDYFGRRFRETFGSAPRGWLVRRRIQHAMLRLDESEDPISVVARELGYPDVFLFSRQFKSITGVSPRSWRERAQSRR